MSRPTDLDGLPIFNDDDGDPAARDTPDAGRNRRPGPGTPAGHTGPGSLSGAVGAVAAGGAARRPAPAAARPADVQPGERRRDAGPWTGANPIARPAAPQPDVHDPAAAQPHSPTDLDPARRGGDVELRPTTSAVAAVPAAPGATPAVATGAAPVVARDGAVVGDDRAGGAAAWVGAGARQGGALPVTGGDGEYVGYVRPRGMRDAEFWRQVNSLRGEVSSRLTNALAARELDEDEREALGQELIQQVVRDHNDAMLSGGERPWTPEYQIEITRALFDALFRLGRLQPLIDTPDVENIEITGTQPVLMLMGDGRSVYAEPIADSDAELIDFLQFLAARDPANERSFTRANPFLNLDLPGRVRLAAVGWVVPSPRVTIRLQRLQAVDLDILRGTGTVDTVLEQFLSAAVRARKSVVVSGQGQGSGKTTMLRALCSALDPWESVATIETDYELYLHLEPEKHRRVVALRTREGSGEMNTSGRRVGEIDTNVNVYESLRHNISRVIVGEVRGPEIVSMFQAMQMGNGSLSTVHADGARDVVERLVGMAVQDSTLSETYAYRQVAQSIDLIVFLRVDVDPGTGLRTRYISEIIEVTRGEAGNPVAVTDVFRPGADGRAVPAHTPSFLADLERVGFDTNLLNFHEGLWGVE